MVAFPLKVEHRIHHVLQHTRTRQGSFLGHMANDEDGDVIGLGQLHEFSRHFSHLRNRSLYSWNLRRHNGLDRIDDKKVRLDPLYLCTHALHIGLSIEVKLAIDISQSLCTEFDLLGRLLATDIENRSHLRQLGRDLKEQGWFPYPWISPDEDQTSWDDTASKDAVEFLHFRLGPMDIDGGHIRQFHGFGLFTRQGYPSILNFCNLNFLHKRRPSSTVWTAP